MFFDSVSVAIFIFFFTIFFSYIAEDNSVIVL